MDAPPVPQARHAAPAPAGPPAAPVGLRAVVRFGRFELQPAEHRLLVDGVPAPLGGRALDLLGVLVENAGHLCSRQQLIDLVWPGLFVEENNLSVQINALRKVLGGEIISTVPGRGYRFTAPLEIPRPPPQLALAGPALPDRHDSALPALLSPLLGRDDELSRLGQLVDGHRLVTLCGAGGMGKTRLALALLEARRADRYPHGVGWVELGAVSEAGALPGTIAGALGIRPGGGDPLAALAQALQPLGLLLALDNAEHLLDGVAEVVQRLLAGAPGLHVLVTSQAPLKLPAERVMRLGPLAVPAAALPAREAQAFGAVALFVERARATDMHFVLDDASAPAVIEVCRRLDGMALAIELAAARAPLLGAAGLLASLEDRLQLLTRGNNRSAPPRQQTLRDTLAWSHRLLDARLQTVFRRLAVVAGSASLSLVLAVAADGAAEGTPASDATALDDWAVLDALDVLVDRSLVALLPGAGAEPPRYRLLDSPRAYAHEQLAAAGELAVIKQRHMRAMAAAFGTFWEQFFSGRFDQDALHEQVAQDFDNARDALGTALAAADATAALTLAATLLQQLPRSFAAERKALVQRCETLNSAALPPPVQLRAWLAVTWARGMIRPLRLLAPARRALALARDLDDPAGDRFELYFALSLLAWSAALEGEPALAQATLTEMRAVEDPQWPPHRRFLGALAEEEVCVRFEANPAEGLRLARRTMTMCLTRGNRQNAPWGNLVDAELQAGDAEAAVRVGGADLALLEGSRNDRGLAYVRLNLAAALLVLGRGADARAVALQGWPQAERYDLQNDWADQLSSLAALQGRHATALQLIGLADAGYRRIEERRGAGAARAVEAALARALPVLGEAEAARLRAEGQLQTLETLARQALAAGGDAG